MQYDANTPEEYLNQLDDDWRREKLEELRTMIKTTAPELEEVINYKMLGYRSERGFIFHLNAQKNFVGFYVGDTKKIDTTGELLAGIDQGKGCIRVKKSVSIPDTHLGAFIEKAVDLWNRGEDIDC